MLLGHGSENSDHWIIHKEETRDSMVAQSGNYGTGHASRPSYWRQPVPTASAGPEAAKFQT